MEITPKIRKILQTHSEQTPHGHVWHGEHIDGEPVFTYGGKKHSVKTAGAQIGMSFEKDHKYYGIEHADMEQSQHQGHTEDLGDGTGESQE